MPMRSRFSSIVAAALSTVTLLVTPALAFDLNGVWASDDKRCDKIFKKAGKQVSFTQMADLYGSGFIVDGNKLKGKEARCIVTSRRETAEAVHLLASCSSDIMLSNVQFSMKVLNDNSLTRFFPDIPGMELTYYRCTM